MKFINVLIISMAVALTFGACNAESKTNSDKETSKKETVDQSPVEASQVAVYYFHGTRRCATCQAVERVSKSAVKDFYDGKIPFASYNVEEDEGAAVAEEVGVKGSALIIVRDGKKVDITDAAFMNARSNPQKLKEVIKEKIEPLKES